MVVDDGSCEWAVVVESEEERLSLALELLPQLKQRKCRMASLVAIQIL